MRSATAAIRYVSGYASKTDQTLPGQKVGRYWGVAGKNNIPWGDSETIELDRQQSKTVLRTCRRFIVAVNRQQRIKQAARQIGLKPNELVSWGGWFEHRSVHWGKHLRRCPCRMQQKIRLRNLRSMNVFLNADFWAGKMSSLLALTR